jgi:DNA-binding GntR family transcriptional regulator
MRLTVLAPRCYRTYMGGVLPALRSAAIRVSAVDAVRNALLEGRFQPGESLSEPSLAAQMGVSRGPVREALLVLEQEGLVVHNQNRGFSVLTLGPEDRRAMVKVRIPLETLALELAKGNATPEDISELEAAAGRLIATYNADLRTSAREDLAFHQKLWEMSANAWLVVALRRVAVPFFLFTIMYRAKTDHLDDATLEDQHRSYIDYLKGATSLSAEECVRKHLRTYEIG